MTFLFILQSSLSDYIKKNYMWKNNEKGMKYYSHGWCEFSQVCD